MPVSHRILCRKKKKDTGKVFKKNTKLKLQMNKKWKERKDIGKKSDATKKITQDEPNQQTHK